MPYAYATVDFSYYNHNRRHGDVVNLYSYGVHKSVLEYMMIQGFKARAAVHTLSVSISVYVKQYAVTYMCNRDSDYWIIFVYKMNSHIPCGLCF